MYSESLSMRAGPPYTPSSRPASVRSAQVGSPGVPSASSPPNVTPDERAEAEAAYSSQGKQEPIREASPMESPAQAYARSYVESLRAVSDPQTEFQQNRPMSGLSQRVDADPVRNDVELDAIPVVAGVHDAARQDLENGNAATSWRRPSKDEIFRQPYQNPVLSPEYRYCSRDEIIKPPRTHHCRICGTVSRTRAVSLIAIPSNEGNITQCVLMFDHHCPWIGQCVGARNRRVSRGDRHVPLSNFS